MAVVIFSDGKPVDVSCRDTFKGMHAFLCCPGPSLSDLDETQIHVPGAVVAAMNTAYPKAVRYPDMWVGMDGPMSYDQGLWLSAFPKFAATGYWQDVTAVGRRTCDSPNIHFVPGLNAEPAAMFDHLGDDAMFCWPKANPTTFFTAMHLLFWMGVERVNLLGCDFGGPRDYFDDRVLPDGYRARNRGKYDWIVSQLGAVAKAAAAKGRAIVSCTPDSPANGVVQYLPLAIAVEAAQATVKAAQGAPVLDGHDSQGCVWMWDKAIAEEGVLTGAYAGDEWMLPWWWENYSKHNKYPVAFIDYGMSDNMVRWCNERGAVLKIDWGVFKGWFRKPKALLRSPFTKTVYMDPDCEVRGDLYQMFAVADQGTGLTLDRHNPWSKEILDPPYAAGVVAYRRNTPVISLWAVNVMIHGHHLRSDQEALNLTIRDGNALELITMPPQMQWLRLDGEAPPDAVVVHWTGPEGKRIIREQMELRARQGLVPDSADCPLVSILIPAYNTHDRFGAAIASCMAQTYPNLELCICDDGSDPPLPIPESKPGRSVKHVRIDHAGYVAAFNAALGLATGQYIARLDADDSQALVRIEEQMKSLLSSPGSHICTCAAVHVLPDGTTEPRPCIPMDTLAMAAGQTGWYPPNATILANKSIYDLIGGFIPPDQGPDCNWNFRAIRAGARWVHVERPLYRYSRHPKQMTAAGIDKQTDRYATEVRRHAAICEAARVAWDPESAR